MKNPVTITAKIIFMLLFASIALLSVSQDTTHTVTTHTTTTTTSWFVQPWVWIAGGAILIIILVAVISGNRKATTEKTVIKEKVY